MRSVQLMADVMMCPEEFIENRGLSQAEERNTFNASYYERRDNVFFAYNIEDGAALLVFVTYVLYHLISKFRGNEKNVKMNNYGVSLAVLGVAYYSVSFAYDTVQTLDHD